MATLSENSREQISVIIQSEISSESLSVGSMTSSDIRAAVDATDDWQNSNAASFNIALPSAAQSNLSPTLKNRLFNLVAKNRWGG